MGTSAAAVPTPIEIDDSDTTVSTSRKILTDFPDVTIYVCDDLDRKVPWEKQDFLRCDHLKLCASPEMEEAELSYVYGPLLQPPRAMSGSVPDYDNAELTQYPPLELNGKYVKIVIARIGQDGGDLNWYGIIEVDDRDVWGGQSNSIEGTVVIDNTTYADEPEPRGKQKFHAFGLARLLELTTVLSSVVNQEQAIDLDETEVTIGIGLPFNSYRAGEYEDRGNRLANPQAKGEPYIFSEVPQRVDLWTAATAAAYLLKNNPPLDSFGDPCCDWKIAAGADDPDAIAALGWYDCTVHTDGKNVKHILDELISRKRGVGWFLTFDEQEGPSGTATINVFTFNSAKVEDASGAAAGSARDSSDFKGPPPNPNQKKLNFENAIDVEEARLTDSVAEKYDQVIAIGAFKTSTATLLFTADANHFVPDWTQQEEDFYRDAASGDADYSSLDIGQQRLRNSRYRSQDQIRNVYRRFQLSDTWPHYTWDPDPIEKLKYLIAPKIDDDGNIANDGQFDESGLFVGEGFWNQGVLIEAKLPLKDRFDYSGSHIVDKDFDKTSLTGITDTIDGEPAHLKPMFFVKTEIDGGDQRFDFLEKLSDRHFEEHINCTWSANVSLLPQRPAIEITATPQHFIAKTRFAGAAAFDPLHDPALNAGVDYTDIRATITVRLFDRIQAIEGVDPETDQINGRINRKLYIPVPDARLDYVVPNTVVAIKNGELVKTDGGFVKDDRDRLRSIARMAAEWYGRERQTLQLKLKNVREVVKIGWLITDIGPNYQLENVNTPITSISFDLLNPKTSFQTSHAELDFS
jgi:hypothetical protein